MSRIELIVPFAEKDEAKHLGTRWDPAQKVGFVSEHSDPARLVAGFRYRRIAPTWSPCLYLSTCEIIELEEEDVEA